MSELQKILVPADNVLTSDQVNANADEYLKLLASYQRDGLKELGDWLLNKTDFFRTPAQTHDKGAYMGGNAARTLRAYAVSQQLAADIGLDEKATKSVGLACLLADVWKCDAFMPTERRKRMSNGTWVTVRAFEFRHDSPQLGHGEKSVIYVQRFTKLTVNEELCIRWAAGFDDETVAGTLATRAQFNNAVEQCPLVALVNTAFTLAVAFGEKNLSV